MLQLYVAELPIYASVKAIIGSDDLSPVWPQAIIWTNERLLPTSWGTNFMGIVFEIEKFSFRKMHLKMTSTKWRSFCPRLNELSHYCLVTPYGIMGSFSPLILGLYSLRRRRLTGMGIPMINLRRSDDRLRFIMGIPILIRWRLLSE